MSSGTIDAILGVVSFLGLIYICYLYFKYMTK